MSRGLQERLMNKEEIWVVNTSHKLGRGPSGIVPIFFGNNLPHLHIPPGDFPVCLTRKVPHKLLEECTSLYSLIDKRVLTLIEPKEANDKCADDPEQAKAIEKRIKELTTAAGPPPIGEAKELKESKAQITPRILGVVTTITQTVKVHGKDAEALKNLEKDSLTQLIQLESSLTEQDLAYVVASGKLPSIKLWAKEALEKRNTEPDLLEQAIATETASNL